METIRAAIIDCRATAADENQFIERLNDLVTQHGDLVCSVIFNTLAALDLPPPVAQKYWLDVQNHRLQLISQLNRNVDLITAISDFLHLFTKFLPNSRLIDAATFERAVTATTHDILTGLYNRPYFDETYEQLISQAKRYDTDLSVLFLDIDDFKDVNDSMGHIAGDVALQEVARIIEKTKRVSDIAARYGGEEFVLLMPHTPNRDAYILAERIRKAIAQTEMSFKGASFQLTISGGLASYPLNSINPKDLLFMADSAVYLAKGAGKNTISQFKQEQRRYLRAKCHRPVLIKELGFDTNPIFSGICKDICMGGLLLENPTPLPLGSLQEMSVTVGEDNQQLLLIGKVVRVEQCKQQRFNIGMSFSFKEMAKQASTQIANFLKKRYFPENRSIQHTASP